jgi:hypothetical protein
MDHTYTNTFQVYDKVIPVSEVHCKPPFFYQITAHFASCMHVS